MILTQESILSLLVAEGGRVKKSDLVDKFRGSVDTADPEERERNRELFKTFVNNVAFVKEIDGERYVVLRKTYQHLLEGPKIHVEKPENEKIPLTGEQQRPPAQAGSSEDQGGVQSAVTEPDQEEASESSDHPTELLSPIQIALQRSKFASVRLKRSLNVDVQLQDRKGINCSNAPVKSKPYALPLRMPPSATKVEIHKLKPDPDEPEEYPKTDAFRDKKNKLKPDPDQPEEHPKTDAFRDKRNKLKPDPDQPEEYPKTDAFRDKRNKLNPDPDEPEEHPKTDAFRDKRRMPSAERGGSTGSPQLRRAAKSTKASEEHKDTRIPSMFPLEHSEHQWLVNCAAGHWSQVYGLLLRDNQLAEKKDFMSGFTALHWAAKTGNSDMLVKIIEKARQGGVHVDINAKTHGGYTPLHIAALHDKQYIIGILVKEYKANISIRDNYGKKAYHYLHKDVSESVREMLCKPKPQPAQDRALHEKEELDLFPDLSKGLHSISRLFQPNVTGHKKKHKQRPGLYSLNNDPIEEEEDSGAGFRHRPMSDVFM
ncbi:ankyrin repeat domain-containing protein SOWAHB-like [Neolamprologus brichardi]|uniref:ankyrin repeat domain-containing protein SOWAHB-like n=1 Tax=Neolamprologus brichardi TaxID=32507 RepID=UPI0003EBCF05|nr:ankyrin repeat domain-containing protein SOWAHB-like [Neolamprologus brichardi]